MQKYPSSASRKFQKIGGNSNFLVRAFENIDLKICWQKVFNFLHVCGKLHDMAYDSVGNEFDSAKTAEEPSELIPSNNKGFSHHEPAFSSGRPSSTQSECRNVSIAMPRNIKVNDLRLIAKKGPQVYESYRKD